MPEQSASIPALEAAILQAKQLAGAARPATYRKLAEALDLAEREGAPVQPLADGIRIVDLPYFKRFLAATKDLTDCLAEDLQALPTGPRARLTPRLQRLIEVANEGPRHD